MTQQQPLDQLLVNGSGKGPSTSNVMYYPQQQKLIRVQESSSITKDNKAAGRDDVLMQQIKNSGPTLLLIMFNKCFKENKIQQYGDSPKISPYTEALERVQLQRVTDHITCVSHVQTLRKNDTLNMLASHPVSNSHASQLLNIIQHIQASYQESMLKKC